MKRYIQFSESLPTLEESIKGYTAQGGQFASKYPFMLSMKNMLYSMASNNRMTLQSDIWRKIDLEESDISVIFNTLYEDDEYVVEFNSLQSFTEDRQRAFTFGGTHLQYIIYKIPKGTQVNGLNIQQESIYPEEREVILGKNRFKAYYSEIEWTSSDNMILTLHTY